VDLQLDDRPVDPIAAAFDVTLRIRTSLPDSTLLARKLCHIGRVLCATPGYLKRSARIKSPDDLRSVDCLVHSFSASPNVWEFEHSGTSEKKAIGVAGAFASNSSIAIRDMLLGNCGVALIPEFVVAQELRSGQLVELLPQWRPTAHFLHALIAPGGNASARVRVFIDFMAERFQDRERKS
jgi:DNA-binding transcriptional LysR family regulator